MSLGTSLSLPGDVCKPGSQTSLGILFFCVLSSPVCFCPSCAPAGASTGRKLTQSASCLQDEDRHPSPFASHRTDIHHPRAGVTIATAKQEHPLPQRAVPAGVWSTSQHDGPSAETTFQPPLTFSAPRWMRVRI